MDRIRDSTGSEPQSVVIAEGERRGFGPKQGDWTRHAYCLVWLVAERNYVKVYWHKRLISSGLKKGCV